MKRYILLIVLFTVFSSGSIFAQLSLNLSTEKDLQDPAHIQKIEDLYSSGTDGTFAGGNDVPIYYKIVRQENDTKGAIMISSGRTEGAIKFKEVIFDLYNAGYSVYIHDHRGQGYSGRMADDPDMGYVDDWKYYVSDMKIFYDEFVKPDKHEKIFLMSHSLGGAVAMSYIEQFPNDFEAAAFSSPMLGLASYICPLAAILSGKTPKYAPGQGGYSNDSSKFVGNDVTGSEIRYYIKIDNNNKNPKTKLGGASVQWLHQSCKMMKSVMKNIEDIKIPILILSASNETVVNPKSRDKFIKKAHKAGIDCTTIMIDDAMHELLMEKDSQRMQMINRSLLLYEGK